MLTKPQVAIENTSVARPLTFIGRCAGTSTERSGRNDAKRALSCINMGHTSVLEHVSVTFRISDVSRSLTHQLVRHRLASFVQQSQRYVKLDLDGNGWYVTPPSIAADKHLEFQYDEQMAASARTYKSLLDHGIRPEDARFVLPEATKTAIVMTMNLRELQSFYTLRSDTHAQWEIRELAHAMREALLDATQNDTEWQELVGIIMPSEAEQ